MSNSKKTVIILVFFELTQIVTIATDSLTYGSIITIAFMMVQIIVFLIWLGNENLSIVDLKRFGHFLIYVLIIMSLYNVVFKTGRFLRALRGSAVYGTENKSFLYSNHEYALYLTTAIIFVVWFWFEHDFKTIKTVSLLGLFGINLIATFSRTVILGGIIAITIMSFSYGRKYFIRLIVTYFFAIVVTLSNVNVYNFIFKKILKDSYQNSGSLVDSGRSSMYEIEFNYFRRGSILQILFGHGYVGNTTGGHDAYLYILNTGGIIMFIFFMFVIVWSLNNAVSCLKKNQSIGSIILGLQILVLLYMVAQTPILFYSSIDSFFITMIGVLIPLYTKNYIINVYNSKGTECNESITD